jgi:hypothetical protein
MVSKFKTNSGNRFSPDRVKGFSKIVILYQLNLKLISRNTWDIVNLFFDLEIEVNIGRKVNGSLNFYFFEFG